MDRDIAASRFGKHRLAACQAAFDRDTALIGLHRDVGAGLHLAFDLHIAARRAGRGIAVIGDELAVNRDSTVAGLSCSVLGRVHLAADHHAAALRLDCGRTRLRVDLALDLDVAIFAQGFGIAAFRGEQVALDRDSAQLSRLELHAVLGRHETADRDWPTEGRQRCRRASIDRAVLHRRADGDCTVFRRDVNSLVGLQRAVDCNRAVICRHLDVMRGIDRTRHADVALVFKLLAVRCREHRVAVLRSQRAADCDIALRRLRRDRRAALDIARDRDIAAGCRQVCRRAACDIARDRDAAIIGLYRSRGTALDIAVNRDIAVSRFGKRCLAACQAAFDRDTAIRRLSCNVGASLGIALLFDVMISVQGNRTGIGRCCGTVLDGIASLHGHIALCCDGCVVDDATICCRQDDILLGVKCISVIEAAFCRFADIRFGIQAALCGQRTFVVYEHDACCGCNRAVDIEVVGLAVRIIADGDILGLAAVGEDDCQVLIAAVAEHDVRRLAGVLQRDVLERIELRIDCEPGTAVKSNARTRLDRSRLCRDGMGRRLVDGTAGLQFQRNSSERAVFQVDFPVT